MADTKISQLPKSSSLAGDELFVFAKGNSNGSVSAETVKKFATKEVNEGLGGKLDKSEWDKKTEQFTQYGIIRETGIVQETHSWQNTPFILINREYDIGYHVRMDSIRNIIIQLYDESMSVVMTKWNDGSITDVKGRIAKEDIPTNAVYFRINNLTGSAGSYSNGPTFESREGATSSAIAAAKKALFIDMWNQACTQGGNSFGRYNAQTGFFELNGLTDISYEEALLIYKRSPNAYAPFICQDLRVRTVLPLTRVQTQTISETSAFEECLKLEVVDALGTVAMSSSNAFYNCQNLREIRHPIQCDGPLPETFFHNCLRLELVKIIIKKSGTYHLECSAHLSLASFRYLVDNSIVATTPITVIVHPDVYAKLTDANTGWYQILLDATRKNIRFATV